MEKREKKLSVFSRTTSDQPTPPPSGAARTITDDEGDRTVLQSPKAGASPERGRESSDEQRRTAAVASFLTQTHADGTPKARAPSRPRHSPEAPPEQDVGIFVRLCCCMSFCSYGDDTRNSSVRGRKQWKKGGRPEPLLGPQRTEDLRKKCLVLDLDETLVHSSFKPIPNPDYVIPVDIEDVEGNVVTHYVYVRKRPGVDAFLKELGKIYEIVVYTASLSKYADPLLDQLDTHKVIRFRLFRESCTCYEGNYVKDLTQLGRELKQTIIIDNSPASYLFQPENAINCVSFIDDMSDRELFYCLPFLDSIKDESNVIEWLPSYADFIAKQAELERKNQR